MAFIRKNNMAQNDFTAESPVWPVNRAGELVFTTGSSDTDIAGFISSSQIPSDPRTGRIKAVFGPAATESAIVGSDLTYYVKEGNQVKFTPNSATGTITKYKTDGSIDFVQTVSSGATYTYGTYSGTQKFVVSASTGSIDATPVNVLLGVQQLAPLGKISGGGSAFGGSTSSGATQNSTWCHVYSAWGDFNAVQLVYINSSVSADTIDLVSVAATTSIYPSGVNNIAQPQGGGVFTTPLSALTDNAGTSTRVPNIYVTPKIACSSLPRAAGELDGGKYPILLVRDFRQTGNTNVQYKSFNAAMAGSGWDSVNEGFTFQAARAPSGDKVTTPGSLTTLTREAVNPITTVQGVIFSYNQKMYTVMPIGDSIWAGANDGVTNNCSFSFKATARCRSAGKMVSFFSAAIAGSTIQEINTRGQTFIAAVKPELVILPSYTINSTTTTQANWDTQWQQVMDLADAQLSLGKRVILVTPLPNNSFNSTLNAFRLIQRQRVINSGLPYVDVEAALVDVAAGNGNWLAGLNADSTHPNPAGHEVIANLLQPVLNSLLP